MSSRAAVLEWALTFVAAALMAVLLAMGSAQAPAQDSVGVGAARELEMPFKLVDAGAAVPAELREAVGLGGEPDEERARALEELERAIEADPAAPGHLLLGAAIAVSEGADDLGLRALDRVADDAAGLETWKLLVDNLHDLARDRPARQIEPTLSELRNADASEWLVQRVLARHAALSGQPSVQVAASAEAQGRASRFAERAAASIVIVGSLLLLGALLLIVWPLIGRALTGAGRTGLGALPSPFIVAATRRVTALWFVGFLAIGLTLELVFNAAGSGLMLTSLNLVSQTLLAGGLSLALIQSLARRPEDPTPLWVPLRLGALKPAGGVLGLLVWILAGLSIAVVVVAAASIIQAAFGVSSEEAQPVLRLFAEGEDPQVRVAIALSAVLMGPIFEEILFRGFIYRNLRDLMGPPLAMLLSALLFGLVHLQVPLIIPLGALGVVLAFLFERSGSLLVPIAVHALWNLGQLLMAQLLVSG
ncbi:MAG: CPBP family intramembrane metalloprotease [Deltaproteobacteria bacterium]|nr:CPBP family intramembrane metalloprotease [Deltaproteobacteria bacterium]MCB9786543.1 CPBP family intramembrane metalloprotease [Deltaproteobacteria bacterium]